MATIVLLDDEPVVRDVARRALTAAGHIVLETASPEQAIAVAATQGLEISLFITNHTLPDGVSGREVAEQILKSRPEILVLQMSGYPEAQLRKEGSLMPGCFFIPKPFLVQTLVSKVQEILSGSITI